MAINTAYGVKPSTTTATTVVGTNTATTILPANVNRLGASISNDSSATLYLLRGTVAQAGTVSNTNYSVAIPPKGTTAGYYELPFGFVGLVQGIWDAATGTAYITEDS